MSLVRGLFGAVPFLVLEQQKDQLNKERKSKKVQECVHNSCPKGGTCFED
jgi:hypothetical protein